jgi:hypothetical protein
MAAPKVSKPFKGLTGKPRKLPKRVSKLERAIQVKHDDTVLEGEEYAYDAWFTVILNVVTQGDADTERIGDRISNLCLDVNFLAKQNGSTANISRFIVIFDKQNTISTQADLLSGSTDAYSYLSHFNYDTQSQFTVLHDQLILHDGVYNDSWPGSVCIKLGNRVTRFNSATTTINTGAVKMFLLSDVADSGNKPAMWMTIRFYFTD